MRKTLVCTLLVLLAAAGPLAAYQFYVGNLHSHTSYSDGTGTPAQAFQYARDHAGIDFLAVTDHHNALTTAEYDDIRAQADAFNQDGVFVAIAGQEWTGEECDHVTVLDADHVFTTQPYDYDALYQEIFDSGSTATFAHPCPGMFNDWAYSPVGDAGINSVEVRNLGEHLRYIQILNNGWRVGTDGSQDNHSPNWGDGPTWTVALACSLTREEILDASRNFRTYSTTDRDLEITFEAAGHLMGDAFSHVGNIPFALDAREKSGADSILRLELYENGLRVAWLETRSDSCAWRPEITPRCGENNYFVRVHQEDYKKAWTSPIWITCSTALPSTPALCAPELDEVVTTLTPDLVWHPSDQADTYRLQYSTSPAFVPGPSTVTVADIEDTCYALERNLGDGKYYFWRVWPTNVSGDGLCSGIGRFSVNVGVFLREEEQRLTSDSGEDTEGSLLQTSGDLWLAWSTNRDGNYEIYWKTSSDGGETWSEEECISQNSYRDTEPCLAETADGDVLLVWSSRRLSGGKEVYYSIFDGTRWSAGVRLTEDPGSDADPCVTEALDGLVWVAWSSDRDGGDTEIYCRSFDGAQWSGVYRLTQSPGADVEPALVNMADGTLWLVWSSDRDGHREIYRKIFDGVSWSADGRLASTDQDAGYPSIIRTWDGQIWLAYAKEVGIFYRMCVSGQWSDEAMLHSGILMDRCPSLAQTQDGRIWLAYTSTRGGNADIYAQRTNGSVTAGALPTGWNEPTPGPALWQSRPNPFSSETLIRYFLPEEAPVDLAIYNVLGRKIRVLAGVRASAGEHTATWDGLVDSGQLAPGGVYFCRLSAGRVGLTQKIILLR